MAVVAAVSAAVIAVVAPTNASPYVPQSRPYGVIPAAGDIGGPYPSVSVTGSALATASRPAAAPAPTVASAAATAARTTAPTTGAPPTTPAAEGLRQGVVVGIAGMCLDLNGAVAVDGGRIQIWTCNGTVAQVWRPAGRHPGPGCV
jgi:hypothetical protein